MKHVKMCVVMITTVCWDMKMSKNKKSSRKCSNKSHKIESDKLSRKAVRYLLGINIQCQKLCEDMDAIQSKVEELYTRRSDAIHKSTEAD